MAIQLRICAPPDNWQAEIAGQSFKCAAPIKRRFEPVGEAFEALVRRRTGRQARRPTPSLEEAFGITDDSAEDDARAKRNGERKSGLHLKYVENYYELLELQDIGDSATDADLKKAYRNMVLRYHPDKNDLVSDEIFKKIQTAYDVLTDPVLRQEYDSTLPFDDSIPSATLAEDADFFEVFGPVFRRNAKWSSDKRVPMLGNVRTPIEKVLKFYDFWTQFKSWRSWPQLNEHDPEEAESREERRWMERRNAAIQRKNKLAEKARLNELVTRARALDPRIKNYNAKDARKKAAAKRARNKKNNSSPAPVIANLTPVSASPSATASPAASPATFVKKPTVQSASKNIVEARKVFVTACNALHQPIVDAQRNLLCQSLEPAELVKITELLYKKAPANGPYPKENIAAFRAAIKAAVRDIKLRTHGESADA